MGEREPGEVGRKEGRGRGEGISGRASEQKGMMSVQGREGRLPCLEPGWGGVGWGPRTLKQTGDTETRSEAVRMSISKILI